MRGKAPALASALFAAAAATATALLAVDGRGMTFTGDEWAYAGHLITHSGPDRFLTSPGSDYLMAVPLLVYQRMFELFGMASYVPYRVVAIALHLACALLVFLLLRRRIGRVPAALATIPFLFLAGAPGGISVDAVSMSARRLPMVLAIGFGLGALLALDRGFRGDAVSCVLLVLSVASHPVALGFLAAAAVLVAMRSASDRRRGAFVVLVPLGLWLAAVMVVGHGASYLTMHRALDAPLYVARSVAAASGALVGALNSPPVAGSGALRVGLPWLAGALAVGGCAWAVQRRLRAGEGWRDLAGFLAAATGLLVLLAATALQPGSAEIGPPSSSRYIYPEAILLLLAVAEAFRGIRVRRRTALVAVPLIALAVAGSVLQLGQFGTRLRTVSLTERAELGAIQQAVEGRSELAGRPAAEAVPTALAARTAVPSLVPVSRRFALGGLTPAELEELGNRYGSQALSPQEIQEARFRVRRLASHLYEQILQPTPLLQRFAKSLGLASPKRARDVSSPGPET
jgi:hypothetical protein